MKRQDKWRQVLAAAESTAATKLRELQQLQAQRDTLKCKEEVLHQIVEGMSTATQLMTASEQYTCGVDRDMLDKALQSLLELELQIQFTLREQPEGLGFAERSASPVRVSNFIEYLHHLFEPAQARKVLAMSDANIIAKLGTLAGECAVMLLKERTQPVVWGRQQSSQCNSSSAGTQPIGASSSASGMQPPSSSNVQTAGSAHASAAASSIAGGPAFEYICLAGTLFIWDMPRFTKIAFTNMETGKPLQPPPLQFWRLVAHKLQLTPDQVATFKGLRDILQTGMGSMFAELEQSVREQQALIQQEVVAQEQKQQLLQWQRQMQAEQELIMQQMQARLEQQQEFLQQQTPAEQQQLVLQMQAYQEQLLQRQLQLQAEQQAQQGGQQQGAQQQGGQQQQQQAIESVLQGSALSAHEVVLKKQGQVLGTWHIIWMHMGIVTMNTLTSRQYAILVSCSYPSICRIDPILDFLDELEPKQRQLGMVQQQGE